MFKFIVEFWHSVRAGFYQRAAELAHERGDKGETIRAGVAMARHRYLAGMRSEEVARGSPPPRYTAQEMLDALRPRASAR